MKGLIIDSFAGGGGASSGIEAALGRPVDIAINHDAEAIRMHRANHPHTKHYCEDVWEVDPVEATGGRPVDLMWASPDCKHFSKAKGGKPVDKRIRGLAWVVVKWAKEVKPRIIILENVEEFQTWGPLRGNRPCPDRKGQTFSMFINQLKRLGYQVDWRELVACDYGAPTSRRRLFLIARCDEQPIVWPDVTHGDPDSLLVKSGVLKPWRSAAEIIDWSIPCPSIFTRKKPLVENTMRRIARGLARFVLEEPDPYLVEVGGGLAAPFISQSYAGGYKCAGRNMAQPLPTVTAVDHNNLVAPYMIPIGYGENKGQAPRVKDARLPLNTVVASNKHFLVAPFLSHYYGKSTGGSVKKPLNTIASQGDHIAEVRAFLIKYYGQGYGQSLKMPLDTVTGHDRFGLVTVQGVDYQIVDIGMRMLEPRELYNAHGFSPGYIIDRGADGKPMTKKEQVAKVGNSVVPVMAEALVRANMARAVMTA